VKVRHEISPLISSTFALKNAAKHATKAHQSFFNDSKLAFQESTPYHCKNLTALFNFRLLL
jgi:hypothetical protein